MINKIYKENATKNMVVHYFMLLGYIEWKDFLQSMSCLSLHSSMKAEPAERGPLQLILHFFG